MVWCDFGNFVGFVFVLMHLISGFGLSWCVAFGLFVLVCDFGFGLLVLILWCLCCLGSLEWSCGV